MYTLIGHQIAVHWGSQLTDEQLKPQTQRQYLTVEE